MTVYCTAELDLSAPRNANFPGIIQRACHRCGIRLDSLTVKGGWFKDKIDFKVYGEVGKMQKFTNEINSAMDRHNRNNR